MQTDEEGNEIWTTSWSEKTDYLAFERECINVLNELTDANAALEAA